MDKVLVDQHTSLFEATFMLVALMVVIPVLRLLDYPFRNLRERDALENANR